MAENTYVEIMSQRTVNWTQYSASARRVFRLEPTATKEEGAVVESELPEWGDGYDPEEGKWDDITGNTTPKKDVQERLKIVGVTAEWPDDENYELTYQYEAPNNGAATSNIIVPSGGGVLGTKSFTMSRDYITIDADEIDSGIGWEWQSSGEDVINHSVVIPVLSGNFEIVEYFAYQEDAIASGGGQVGFLGGKERDENIEWLFVGMDVEEATQADGSPAYTARRKYEYKHIIPARVPDSPTSDRSSWNIRWNKQIGDWDVALDPLSQVPFRFSTSALPDAEFLPIPHDPTGPRNGSDSSG